MNNNVKITHVAKVCAVACLSDRELIFWVDRKAPVWAIQVSPAEIWTEKKNLEDKCDGSAVGTVFVSFLVWTGDCGHHKLPGDHVADVSELQGNTHTG